MRTITSHRQTRNTNIEILRFILISFICFWHIIIHGYNFKHIGQEPLLYHPDISLTTFLLALFSPAVFCFMFISGWYGIAFSKKKLSVFVFSGICCYFCSWFIRYIWTGDIILRALLTHLLPIASGRWWFLTGYIQVFLIAPFIEAGIKSIKRETFKYIVFIMTMIEIGSFINLVPNYGSTFYGLLYIYIIARYFRLQHITFSTASLLATYICSLILLWLLCNYFAHQEGGRAHYAFILLNYNNPLIIFMAISIFLLCNKLHPSHNIRLNSILSNVLAVYLMTEGIDNILYQYEAQLISKSPYIGIVLSILIIIGCLIFGKILMIAHRKIYGLIFHDI